MNVTRDCSAFQPLSASGVISRAKRSGRLAISNVSGDITVFSPSFAWDSIEFAVCG